MTGTFDDLGDTEVVDRDKKIYHENRILFHYINRDGILYINAETELLNNNFISANPVDLCFPFPDAVNKHYCFKNVRQIKLISAKKQGGLIKRFSRFFRGK